VEGQGRLPNFFIIGAMKSGTTTLRVWLNEHPEAFSPRELHFFDEHFDKGLDWYREQFAGAGDAKAVGEKCPSYMARPRALERLKAAIPSPKLIAVLRDPVNRAYSHYWHQRRLGAEPLSFEEALEAEPDRVRGHGEGEVPFDYVERGRYLRQLERVAEMFGRDRLKVFLFEDQKRDGAAVFHETCEFLGIDASVPPGDPELRANPYRANPFEKTLGDRIRKAAWRLLPASRRPEMRAAAAREYPAMKPETRDRLRARYAEDNAALAKWLGRDLSVWSS
jgi:hypothetical protein